MDENGLVEDIIDEILKKLISKNIGIEVNTSGLRYGLKNFHPHINILKRYKNDWNDASINTLSFTCGTGNTGYFGIPLSMILLSPESANLFIFATLGSLLYVNTTGFYVTAKGSFTARQSIIKVIKLPLLYAFILGLCLNILGFKSSLLGTRFPKIMPK